MWFNLVPIDIWRYVPPSGFVPDTHVFYTTVSGTFMPLSGSDAIRNNQKFADVKKLIICEIDYKEYFRDEDEVYVNNTWYRIRTVEAYENILPHVAVYLGDSQWVRGG
jgi:hypothetical protein